MIHLLTTSIDTILSILGLILSLGGFIPVFLIEKPKKIIVITIVMVLTALVIISILEIVRDRKHKNEVELVSAQIIERLENVQKLTFDELYQQLFQPDFSIVSEAIEILINNGKVKHMIMELEDDGTKEKFRVRSYYIQKSN